MMWPAYVAKKKKQTAKLMSRDLCIMIYLPLHLTQCQLNVDALVVTGQQFYNRRQVSVLKKPVSHRSSSHLHYG